MSVLIAFDELGRGLDMSGLTNGLGIFINDSSITVTFLFELEDGSFAYHISGAPPITYSTVTIQSFNVFTNEAVISDIFYFNADVEPLIAWGDMSLLVDLDDDFSFGYVISAFNGPDLIIGNKYSDLIKGGFSDDFLYGWLGSDILYGEAHNDRLFGEGGNDKLFGGSGNDKLTGGSGADDLRGGSGVDVLIGGTGNDSLRGEGDKDHYVFNTKPSASNVDTIRTFNHADDTIRLDDDIFTALRTGAKHTLGRNQYKENNTGNATDADDRIIYNKVTGDLYYDSDGSGPAAKVQFATIYAGPDSVDYNDFLIVT